MKNLKNLILILLVSLFVFTSCENEDAIIEDQNVTEESASITNALTAMKSNFDQSGNVNQSNNPAGNMVFDFCFDFVYPITLSYNNGTTVTVSNIDGLINVIINSTDQLFVDGIAFPFDVETYDNATNAIVIVTITNETEFENLLDSCSFSNPSGCACPAVYDPVCVNITDPTGIVFTISYPNECEAICDGFTQADFIDDCYDNDYFDFGFGCFELNFPLDLILDDGSTITINDDDEFGNAMFNQYVVNFVYPISVTLEDDNSVVTINNELDFENLLNTCFTNGGGGIDGCDQCDNTPIDPVCIQYTTPSGEVVIEAFPNLCYAQCFGFDASDVVDCDDDNNGVPCTDDAILNQLIGCPIWSAEVSGNEVTYTFGINSGIVTVNDASGNAITSGTWQIVTDPGTGSSFLAIDTTSGNFTDVWFFYGCGANEDLEVVSSLPFITDIECN